MSERRTEQELRDEFNELSEGDFRVVVADRDLAQALIDAAEGGDEVDVIEAEGEIIARLGISPDETEQGLTRAAVERIERFVSDSLGRPWTYQDVGMLGVDGVSR